MKNNKYNNNNNNDKYEHPSVQMGTLPNGMRIIHMPFASEISYCGVAVDTGTRDEYADEQGMAHFVEHLLFKGTTKRKAHHINNRMENVGGELNAYTTKEETFIFSTFLTEYFERAVELLGDVVCNSTFPNNQIEKECEVILDEINSYEDFPSELIYDDFENQVYANSDLGHYILGTSETISSFDNKKVKIFFKRQYRPHNMVFFSFGKTPFAKVMKLCEKYFQFDNDLSEPVKERIVPIHNKSTIQILDKDTSQAHVMLGQYSSDMFNDNRFALYLLNNILGGGNASSRLNNSLREKNGLVYNVESIVSTYTDTGLFSVYFASDKKHIERCLKLINKEMQLLCEKPLTASQLAIAKRMYKGHMGIASQNNESVVLRMGKSFLHYNDYLSLSEMFNKIDMIEATDLQDIANRLFNNGEFMQLRYV